MPRIIVKNDPGSVETVAAILAAGGVAVIPTDTVYGFSAPVPEGAERIRRIKGRGDDKPFIQLIADPGWIRQYALEPLPEELLSLWPGPVTIIIPDIGGGTTAFRCPADRWLRSVISKTGKPLYSTSVNRSGEPVLWKIKDIIGSFGGGVPLIVDDGDKPGGVPSTIVAVESGSCRIVRQGTAEIPPSLL
ncbi:MAG: L-threonylcarbamoyladenylate synthase [Spirochaetaceae bacterium]|jgi:L-threonylcarbamoyladenylate synthase|nr:L-threonylcarbamoyladenylate synthase [Spirochaetaceae bacterium]